MYSPQNSAISRVRRVGSIAAARAPGVIIDAYIAGLSDEDADVNPDQIRLGAIGNLVIRSAFTALPVELIDEADGDTRLLFERRARYARFLVDLGDELLAHADAPLKR